MVYNSVFYCLVESANTTRFLNGETIQMSSTDVFCYTNQRSTNRLNLRELVNLPSWKKSNPMHAFVCLKMLVMPCCSCYTPNALSCRKLCKTLCVTDLKIKQWNIKYHLRKKVTIQKRIISAVTILKGSAKYILRYVSHSFVIKWLCWGIHICNSNSNQTTLIKLQ